ncbi:hypothetical protein Clacol_001664 [Clathrus columnatus]|uniref:MARVEL domain-containing protein n=1 Tax=Clathrus columnatus TaxID=1419009 RepID=A0AAV5A1I8_9AGAM|nr:hypothetical protein Clacol_001664 [Clathrus columnatus]
MRTIYANIRLYVFISVIVISAVTLGLAAHLANQFLPNLRGVLWLTMAAWTVDMVGGVQCSMLGSQTIDAKNGKTISAVEWCREMKVIEATSWAVFVIFAIFFIITIALATRAQSIGRYNAWAQSISDLPWWAEGNDYIYGPDSQSSYGGNHPSSANRGYPLTQQYPPGAQVIQQQAGHSLLIRPGQNGQPAFVQQVPGTVVDSRAQGFYPPQDA